MYWMTRDRDYQLNEKIVNELILRNKYQKDYSLD